MKTTAIDRMLIALDKNDNDIDRTRSWAEVFDRSILDVLDLYEEESLLDEGERSE